MLEQYSFTPKQRYVLYLVAGLLWLVGIAISYNLDGVSIRSFTGLTLALIICVFSTQKVKLWVNISVIAMGIFYIVMWYSDYLNPSGTPDVKHWWIYGLSLTFTGIYWLLQRALASRAQRPKEVNYDD